MVRRSVHVEVEDVDPDRAIERLDEVTYDEVAQVAAGITEEGLGLAEAAARGPEYARKKQVLIELLAAKALKVPPAQCVVVEDAPAGIAEARAGGMASVRIGRLGDEAMLQAARTDLVVTSLDQVDTTAVPDGILRTRPVMETSDHA